MDILRLPSDKRTMVEEKSVMEFLKTLRFFKQNKIKERGILEMIPYLKHEDSEKGQQKCVYGRRGDQFCILLKGRCSVWLPIPNERISTVISSFAAEMETVSKPDDKAFS